MPQSNTQSYINGGANVRARASDLASSPEQRSKAATRFALPNHRPRAAPGPPQHPTPPGMTPGDSQGRARATGARGLATHHRYVAVAAT